MGMGVMLDDLMELIGIVIFGGLVFLLAYAVGVSQGYTP